ncbi:MAG TPA: hypothetical protein VI319_16335 [Burkholderiales bacterium]
MTIEFLPLLTLEATHDYYGGRCPDVAFWMPSGTQRLLAGAHVLAKPREDRLNVLFERKDGGGAFEPRFSLAGSKLQIGLKLLNPEFANFTVLPLVAGGGLPLYRSGPSPGALQAPVGLLLDPAHPDDAELLREGLLCLVEITLGAGFYAAPPAFAVPFAARAETLKYYVVARNYTAGEFAQIDVSDTGFGADARPQIHFDRVASSAFGAAEIPATQLGAPDARVALFRSQQPVARRSKARTRIQLARNNDVIVAQLPQPGAAAATADLVVHLSK